MKEIACVGSLLGRVLLYDISAAVIILTDLVIPSFRANNKGILGPTGLLAKVM